MGCSVSSLELDEIIFVYSAQELLNFLRTSPDAKSYIESYPAASNYDFAIYPCMLCDGHHPRLLNTYTQLYRNGMPLKEHIKVRGITSACKLALKKEQHDRFQQLLRNERILASHTAPNIGGSK